MATIAANITAISNAKSDLADNLTTKGVTASNTEPLATLVGKVLDITSGGISITGETTVTGLASENITAGDTVVRKKISGIDGDGLSALTNPDVLPTAEAYGVCFSPNGDYMVVAHDISPYISIYKRSGDTYSKLSNPSVLPTGMCSAAVFSPDSVYLAIAAATTSPYVLIYKRSGDTFTKLDDLSPTPGWYAGDIDFSPDGVYLAFTSDSSPYYMVYKRDGDTFTKLTGLPVAASFGQSVHFSPDGLYLAVGHNSSPYVSIFKRSGDVFTKLDSINGYPTGTGYGVDFSNDGLYLAVAHQSSPYFSVYKRDGDVFTKIADPTTLPTGTGNGIAFSNDSAFIIVAHATSPFCSIYKMVDDVLTKLNGPSFTQACNDAKFSPGNHIAIATNYTPYVRLFSYENSLNISKANNLFSYVSGSCDIGYATATVTSGNTATMKSIIRNPSNYPA